MYDTRAEIEALAAKTDPDFEKVNNDRVQRTSFCSILIASLAP